LTRSQKLLVIMRHTRLLLIVMLTCVYVKAINAQEQHGKDDIEQQELVLAPPQTAQTETVAGHPTSAAVPPTGADVGESAHTSAAGPSATAATAEADPTAVVGTSSDITVQGPLNVPGPISWDPARVGRTSSGYYR
jgi:hypothetical protein